MTLLTKFIASNFKSQGPSHWMLLIHFNSEVAVNNYMSEHVLHHTYVTLDILTKDPNVLHIHLLYKSDLQQYLLLMSEVM